MTKLIKELQTKTVKDLEKEVVSLHSEIAKLSVEKKVKPEKDTNLLAKKRKRLAVVMTLIIQKKSEVQK